MPHGDNEDKANRLRRQVMRGGRALLRARKKPLLPSNLSNAINKQNHQRQGIIPYGLGVQGAEHKARRRAGKAQEELSKMDANNDSKTKQLKKLNRNLRNQNLNRARDMAGDSNFSSRNKFKSEDNERVSKPEF